MSLLNKKNIYSDKELKVWVLAPHLETKDENIDYYYDFSQSIEEYKKVFSQLQLQWEWKDVTLQNYREVIDQITVESKDTTPLVMNLCDGDEINGAPGISVIHYLKEKKKRFTGSDILFYENTTSKITMKKIFDENDIPHASWKAIHHPDQYIKGISQGIGIPFIVKPAVSGGSMGLTTKNVIHDEKDLYPLIQSLFEGYRGWDFAYGGFVAERFIKGSEFTVFIVGSHTHASSAQIYTAVERLFNKALPDTEKFLSFDRLWETYENEQPLANQEDFYQYRAAASELQQPLKELAWDAYRAVQGTGYGRVDIRMDQEDGKLYVLEVNAQCGLSEDENYTSIGAIARIGAHPYADMIAHILEDACMRYQSKVMQYKIH